MVEIIIYNNHRVIEKRKISADTYIELDGISYGLSVQVVIGLDVLWQTDFKKKDVYCRKRTKLNC